MNESHRHIHHGMSSKDFLDSESIISTIGLKEDQTVLDVGCGEGNRCDACIGRGLGHKRTRFYY